MGGPEHAFSCKLTWTGAAAGGTRSYRGYDRGYRVEIPGKPSLEGSAAPAFRGDGAKHNPEDLLVAALSACHCSSYLAVCARSRVEVIGYEDEATGRMALVDGGLRFVEVVLRPRVRLAPDADEARALRLHDKAHAECFIARSVAFEVRHEAAIL